MGGDEPAIPEWVLDPADAIAVKLIGHRADEVCPRCHGTLDRTIDILDVEMNGDWRTTDGLRAAGSDLGVLVGQHDAGIPDLNLGMPDPAPTAADAHYLFGSKRLFIEGNGGGSAAQDQVRRHGVIALGNGFHCCSHIDLLCAVL